MNFFQLADALLYSLQIQESVKTLLKLINVHNTITGYEKNTKTIVFHIRTCNEQLKPTLKCTKPHTIAPKRINKKKSYIWHLNAKNYKNVKELKKKIPS